MRRCDVLKRESIENATALLYYGRADRISTFQRPLMTEIKEEGDGI